MRCWADVGLWVAMCFLAKISLHRPACKTTFARLTQWQAISHSFRVFTTPSSCRYYCKVLSALAESHHQNKMIQIQILSDQWEIRLYFIFRKCFLYQIAVSLSFTMVIKRSPGGQAAGGGQSTSKSTCEVPAWLHLAIDQHPVCPHLAPAWTLTSEFDRINWPLTSDMFTFRICTRVLGWSCLKAVSVSTFVLLILESS